MFVLRNEIVVIKEHLGALRLKTRAQNTFNYCFEGEVRISIGDILVSHGLTMEFIVDKRQQRLYLVTCRMESPIDSIIVRELAVPRFNEQWLDVCHTNHLVTILNSDSKLTVFEWKFSKDRKPILNNVQSVFLSKLHMKGFVIPDTMRLTGSSIESRLFSCNECIYLIQTVAYHDMSVEETAKGLIYVHTTFLLERILGEYMLIPKFSFSSSTPSSFIYSTAIDRSTFASSSPYKVSLREHPILLRFILGDHILDLDCRTYRYNIYVVKDLCSRINHLLFGNEKRKGMPYLFNRNEIFFADFTSFEIYKDLSVAEVSSSVSNTGDSLSNVSTVTLATHSDAENLNISIFNKRVHIPDSEVALDIGSQHSGIVSEDSLGISISTTAALAGTLPSVSNSDIQTSKQLQLSNQESIPRITTPQSDIQTSLTLQQLKSPTMVYDLDNSASQYSDQKFSAAFANLTSILQGLVNRQTFMETVLMQELSTYRHAHEYLDLRLTRLESMIEGLCAAEGLAVDPCSGIPAAFVPIDGLYDPADPADPPKVKRIQDSRELKEIRELKELQICDSFIDGPSKDRGTMVDEVRSLCVEIKRLLMAFGNKGTPQKASILSDCIQTTGTVSTTLVRTPISSSMPPLPPRPKSALTHAPPPRVPSSLLKPSSSCGDLSSSLPVPNSSHPAPTKLPKLTRTPTLIEFNDSLDKFINDFPIVGPVIASPSIPPIQKTSNYLSALFSLVNAGCYLSKRKDDPSSTGHDLAYAFNLQSDDYQVLNRDSYSILLTTSIDVIGFIKQFFNLNILEIAFDNSAGLDLSIEKYPFLYVLQQSVSTLSVCRKNSIPDEDEPSLTLETAFERETNCLTELLCEESEDETHEKVVASGLINPIVLRFIRANPFIHQIPADKLVRFLDLIHILILMNWNKKIELHVIKLLKPIFFTIFPRIFVKNTSYASQVLNVSSSYEYMDIVWLSCLQYIHLFIHRLHAIPYSDDDCYGKHRGDEKKELVSPAWRDNNNIQKVSPIFI